MAGIALALTIRDLTRDDLPACAWTGSPKQNLAAALERADRGEIDYLVVCPPSGLPVAVGGIDYTLSAGAGTLYQLAVHGALHSCGTGTLLIGAAEQRIRARGLLRAELAVEQNNPARGRSTSGSVTSPTAAGQRSGASKPTTDRSPATARCAR
jgi:ribosomal protein S18 acetylase RimI-like enzyme